MTGSRKSAGGGRDDGLVKPGGVSGRASTQRPDKAVQAGQGDAASTPAQVGRPAVEDPDPSRLPGRRGRSGTRQTP